MNNPFDYIPSPRLCEAMHSLELRLEALAHSGREEDLALHSELCGGKMLGVLIAEDAEGKEEVLYAFSGQLGSRGFQHPDFVGPVFDYLQPSGHFRLEERRISALNAEIAAYEREILAAVEGEYARADAQRQKGIAEYREQCRLSKERRQRRRAEGCCAAEEAEMIRESQYEKAELRRLKQRLAESMHLLESRLAEARTHLQALKERRRLMSERLQRWLFESFRIANARGEERNLLDIFADTALRIPPSGAGECCGPKLMHAAHSRGLRPIEMAEYWYGPPKEGELRIHGQHYPACRGKCLPILTWMLEGLEVSPPLDPHARPHARNEAEKGKPEVIYENDYFCVVSKPSGMLSVPGKGKQTSVQQWLEERYAAKGYVRVAHRLDQDTSGLLIAAFSPEEYTSLQRMFEGREVQKCYMALLDGDYREHGIPEEGCITLRMMADHLDRPRQRVDPSGKEAITDYKIIGVEDGCTRVLFYPHTGRTHQLRVTAASPHGLGMPIHGDTLYSSTRHTRLCLHAMQIAFRHPATGVYYRFEIPSPF